MAGAFLIIIQPVEPSIGRDYIGRIFAICVLGGMTSFPGMVVAAMLIGIVESITATFYGPSWAPAVAFGFLLITLAVRPAGLLRALAMRTHPIGTGMFWLLAAAVGIGLVVLTRFWFTNEYFFFAAYVVLQYIVLATAWNILGGYTGYINFGTGAFFAIGAYSTVVLHNLHAKPALMQDWFGVAMPAVPLPVMILVGGIVAGLVGLGTGYLTLRLRGVFFAIATLALAVVVQTLIVNWDYVGGSRGTLYHPAGAGAARRRLYPVSLHADDGADRRSRSASRARSSARGSGSVSPRSATTSRPPRRAACRPCG